MIFDFYSDFVALYFSTFLSRCLSLHPQLIMGQWTNLVCTNLLLCDLFVSTKSYFPSLNHFSFGVFDYPRFKKQDTELTPPTFFVHSESFKPEFSNRKLFVVHLFIPSLQINPPGNCVTRTGRSCWDESSWHWIAINYYNDTHFSCDGHHTPILPRYPIAISETPLAWALKLRNDCDSDLGE